MMTLNSRISGMSCIRCSTVHPVADYFEGCPRCLLTGFPASVALRYEGSLGTFDKYPHGDWLAYPGGPFLGEGRTPLVALQCLANQIGVGSLHAKYEGANPTGSHKDRMSALVVQRAKEVGASTVAAASSGNAGTSLAAYAAHAGLNCVIVTTPNMSANWRRAVKMHGAELIDIATAEERWQIVARQAKLGKWYPVTNYLTPAVGSSAFGVDGYRAIAFEIFDQCSGAQPTDILVPTSRGDALWGIAQGYCDLLNAGMISELPKVHAVEPFPRLALVMSGTDLRANFPGSSALVSLGGSTVTFQAVKALTMTGGSAAAVDEAHVVRDQIELARAGMYLELSSASALTGLRKLVHDQTISAGARVVLIATSHGYKEDARYEQPL
jgi:threonine synthase